MPRHAFFANLSASHEQHADESREWRVWPNTCCIHQISGDTVPPWRDCAVLNLINRRVRVRLRDVCIPDVDELLATLYGEEIVEGTIVDVSDSGDTRQGFAVVQLVGVDKPVVVPLELILSD
jgi:hypothetical protein